MGIAASDGRLIRPIDEPTMARVDFDWNAVRVETLLRSPELRQKKWLIKQRELELVSAKNQLLPQLDVGALYRWTGTGDHLFGSSDKSFADTTVDARGTTALSELTSGDWQEAAFFFNFAMPVGFRSALAGVRNAQLLLAREKAQLEDTELNTIHLLNTAVRRLDANYVLAQTHFNRWSAAEVDVDAAQAKYEIGARDGTLDLVLEAQRRRALAQVDYYNALIEYNKGHRRSPFPQRLAAGIQQYPIGRGALAAQGLLGRTGPSPRTRRQLLPGLRLHASRRGQPRSGSRHDVLRFADRRLDGSGGHSRAAADAGGSPTVSVRAGLERGAWPIAVARSDGARDTHPGRCAHRFADRPSSTRGSSGRRDRQSLAEVVPVGIAGSGQSARHQLARDARGTYGRHRRRQVARTMHGFVATFARTWGVVGGYSSQFDLFVDRLVVDHAW
jgi:hypothetical protein